MGKIWLMILCLLSISLVACSEGSLDPDNQATSSKHGKTLEHFLDLGILIHNEETRQIVVQKGDKVKLVISSQQQKKIHLHGYDIEKSIPSNGEVSIEFEADATGRFQITSHAPLNKSDEHSSHGAGHSKEHDHDDESDNEEILAILEVRPR